MPHSIVSKCVLNDPIFKKHECVRFVYSRFFSVVQVCVGQARSRSTFARPSVEDTNNFFLQVSNCDTNMDDTITHPSFIHLHIFSPSFPSERKVMPFPKKSYPGVATQCAGRGVRRNHPLFANMFCESFGVQKRSTQYKKQQYQKIPNDH